MAKEEKKEKEKEIEDPHRQIIPRVEGAAAAIFEWLEDLFQLGPRDAEPGKVKSEADSFPERIVLRAVTKGAEHGAELKSFEWKPTMSALPTREKLVDMANRLSGIAKRDAAALGRAQRYGVFAYSSLKGDTAYERCLFVVEASSEFREGRRAASDDEDTHRDRLLSASLAHSRWQTEQFSESMSSVMRLQQEIIRDQQSTIRAMESDRRAFIAASEEALSRKQEREINAEWAKIKIGAIQELIGLGKNFLPAVQIYLTRGKSGVVEGLRTFLDSLTEEQQAALFGQWNEAGECLAAGILDDEQRAFLKGILEGRIDPRLFADFMSGLRSDQVLAAQSSLGVEQLQALGALAKAINDVNEREATRQ